MISNGMTLSERQKGNRKVLKETSVNESDVSRQLSEDDDDDDDDDGRSSEYN